MSTDKLVDTGICFVANMDCLATYLCVCVQLYLVTDVKCDNNYNAVTKETRQL
jgi:type IV secretory pathway VirB3-like protein